MTARLFTRLAVCAALIGSASAARPQSAAPRGARHSDAHPRPTPESSAQAYLSGKQALVGLHAPVADPAPRDSTGRVMLALRTINRREFLAVPASTDEGGFSSLDLDRVAHLLRATGGEEHPMDPRVVDLVYRIQAHFDAPEIRVVSGYRAPTPGSHSNHGRGRAVDLVVPAAMDEDVAEFVRGLGFVGVGIYPAGQFVHVDIRPHSYFWVDFSRPHASNREHGILRDLAIKSDAQALAQGRDPIEPFAIAGDVDAALGAYASASTPATSNEEEDDDP